MSVPSATTMTPQTPYWLVVTRPARTKPRSRPKTLRPTRNAVLTTAPRAACSRRVRPPSRSARVAVDTARRLPSPGARPGTRARGAGGLPRRRLRRAEPVGPREARRRRARAHRRRARLLPPLRGLPLRPHGVRHGGDEGPLPRVDPRRRGAGRAAAGCRLRDRLRRTGADGRRLPGHLRGVRQPLDALPALAAGAARDAGAGRRPRRGIAGRTVRPRVRLR